MALSTNISSLHVFRILRLMRADPDARSVSQISRKMELPPTTVHRAIATLEEADFLQRSDNGTYEIGVTPQLLARALFNRFPLREASLPTVKQLAAASGETASLCVRLGWYSVCVSASAGERDVYSPQRLGETALLHRTLRGRGILDFLNDEQLERYRRFVRVHYPEQIDELEKSAFVKGIQGSRKRGFASEAADMRNGFLVSMPVRKPGKGAIGSLTVNGPVLADAEGHGDPRVAAWLGLRDGLERMMQESPSRFIDPFDHLDADQVRIHVTQV
jgi:DNA-binding IclR family transcriptional regulator